MNLRDLYILGILMTVFTKYCYVTVDVLGLSGVNETNFFQV